MKNTHANNGHHHADGAHTKNAFENVELFLEIFDGPARDAWQKPGAVIKSFNLTDTAVVVEIGSGTGYFAVRLASLIPNGKVICFDRALPMVTYLTHRAQELGLVTIDSRKTNSDGTVEFKEKADLIFSVDVYHHLENRITYFSNLKDNLKRNGVLVIIDRNREEAVGQPTGHQLAKDEVIAEMKNAGFELVSDFDFLLPVQYHLTFKSVL